MADVIFGGSGSASWGNVSGDIVDQADLSALLPQASDTVVADFVDGDYRDGSGAVQSSLANWLTAVAGTFTRGGSHHRYINSSGYLTNGDADTLRVTYDPISLRKVGALLEPSRTNLLPYSDALTNAKWAFSNVNITVTANNATGIAGTSTAATVVETTTSNVQHRLFYYDASVSITSGSVYCYSVYLKSIGGRNVQLAPSAGTGLGTTNISFSKQFASNGWNMEKHGNGIFRVWKSAAATSTGIPSFAYYTYNGSSTTFTGTTGTGFQIEKAQYEQVTTVGDPPTSYIDNPSSTATTRPADALAFTLPAATLYSVYGDGAYTSASVSSGSYSYTPSSTYPIVRRLATAIPAGSDEVAGKRFGVKLTPSDVGLSTSDTINVQSGYFASGDISLGTTGVCRALGAVVQLTNGRDPVTSSLRSVIIGNTPAMNTPPSNSMCIGNDAGKLATTFSASNVYGDTAAATATSINNCVIDGNEAGNQQATLGSCVLVGNFAGRAVASSGQTASATVAIGTNAGRFNTLDTSVIVGSSAGYAPVSGSITSSVIIGANAGDNIAAAVSNLILIGYGIEAPTDSTSNWMNIGGVINSNLSSNTIALTTQAGNGISVELKTMTAPSTPASGKLELFARTNGGSKLELCALMPDGVVTVLATET